MAGRRSERSRKPVKYSKYSTEDDESDKDDEDDFMDPTPPTKRKKSKKSPDTTFTDAQKPIERKARNRLTDEEKYERQLQEALKMSLVDSDPQKGGVKAKEPLENESNASTTAKTSKTNPETLVSTLQTSLISTENSNATSSPSITTFNGRPKIEISPFKSSQDSTTSESGVQISCVVQADVFDSPNTKSVNDSKQKAGNVDIKKKLVTNEAALCKDDEICVATLKDNKETGRRRSERSKIINNEEEEDYKMSSDSESEDDLSEADSESDFSDYQETPKKKGKKAAVKIKNKEPKKPVAEKKIAKAPARKRSAPNKENLQSPPLAKKIEPTKPTPQVSTPRALPKPLPARKPMKPLIQKTSVASTLPKTPKTCSNLLSRRSPALLPKPGKFIQPGWTPPGPAGLKSSELKSPQSPNFIRVGLSRNVKLTPLHSKFSNKL